MTVPKLRTVEQRMTAVLYLIGLIVVGLTFYAWPAGAAVAVGIHAVLAGIIAWIVKGE